MPDCPQPCTSHPSCRTPPSARAGVRWAVPTLLFAVLAAVAVPPLVAQETDEIRWRNSAELTYLVSGGNSAASTLGLRSSFRRTAPTGELRLDVSGLRTDATRTSRTAVGDSPDDFRVERTRTQERSAERYAMRSRYDRNLAEHFFAFGGLAWERNVFAGFNHRTVAVTGAGNQWGRDDAWVLKIGYGLTYTLQRDVTPDPERDEGFAGLQVTLDHGRQLTEGTAVEVNWVVDGNAQELSDLRAELVQSVTAALTSRLALKTSLRLKVDNDPPLESIPLVTQGGEDTGERVLTPLRKVDHDLSVALVITF